MLKAVLFDLDGTLLDTGKGVIKSVEYTIKRMGVHNLTQKKLESFVGPPIKNKLKDEFDLDEATAVKGMNIFRKHYGEEDIYIAEPYAGIEDLLIKLRELNIKIGVATYKREDQAIKLLQKKGLYNLFDVVHGSDPDGMMSKADVVRLCINDLGCQPTQVVMVGDSDNDAIGASTVGSYFIGVTYGYGFKDEESVRRFENIGIVNKCSDILKLVMEF